MLAQLTLLVMMRSPTLIQLVSVHHWVLENGLWTEKNAIISGAITGMTALTVYRFVLTTQEGQRLPLKSFGTLKLCA
jgi:hypothetical protein